MWKAPEIGLPLIYTLPSSCCLRDLKLQFTKLYAQSLSPQRCKKIYLWFPACFFFLGLWWDTAASSGDLQDVEQQREAHPAGWTLRRPSGPDFRSHLWWNQGTYTGATNGTQVWPPYGFFFSFLSEYSSPTYTRLLDSELLCIIYLLKFTWCDPYKTCRSGGSKRIKKKTRGWEKQGSWRGFNSCCNTQEPSGFGILYLPRSPEKEMSDMELIWECRVCFIYTTMYTTYALHYSVCCDFVRMWKTSSFVWDVLRNTRSGDIIPQTTGKGCGNSSARNMLAWVESPEPTKKSGHGDV